MTDKEIRQHLRNHLTDGYWHDDCPACLQRRRCGGTGVSEECQRAALARTEPPKEEA